MNYGWYHGQKLTLNSSWRASYSTKMGLIFSRAFSWLRKSMSANGWLAGHSSPGIGTPQLVEYFMPECSMRRIRWRTGKVAEMEARRSTARQSSWRPCRLSMSISRWLFLLQFINDNCINKVGTKIWLHLCVLSIEMMCWRVKLLVASVFQYARLVWRYNGRSIYYIEVATLNCVGWRATSVFQWRDISDPLKDTYSWLEGPPESIK